MNAKMWGGGWKKKKKKKGVIGMWGRGRERGEGREERREERGGKE